VPACLFAQTEASGTRRINQVLILVAMSSWDNMGHTEKMHSAEMLKFQS